MFQSSNVSLFASVWPDAGGEEEQSLNKPTRIPSKGQLSHFKVNYQKMLTYGQLVLKICQSTADSIVSAQYKNFDALVKNFGCQMTALDVQRKVKSKSLHAEALEVQKVCAEKFTAIPALFQKPPEGVHNMTVLEYLKRVGLDIEISSEFADLVNFRLLHIIHDTKLESGEEVPITNLDPLDRIKNKLEHKETRDVLPFKAWVHGIQVKESRKAVRFVQTLAKELAEQDERVPLIRRMVSSDYLREARPGRKCSPIVALPQLYSTEAVMRAMKGILVVKNKLTLSGSPIKDAQADKVFIRMPEQRILNEGEIAHLKPNKPVVVLEGFRGLRPLEETITSVCVIKLLNAILSRIPQYTSSFPQSPLGDEEAEKDIAEFAKQEELIKFFRADHMYCSSVEEERDVKPK